MTDNHSNNTLTYNHSNNTEFIKNQQDMEIRRLTQNEIVNLIDETREIITKHSKAAPRSKDIIGLEVRYNEFTSKYKNEQRLIDINKVMEDFVKGDKDCLEMYNYMKNHVNIAKNYVNTDKSQLIEGTPEQVKINIVTKEEEEKIEKEIDTLAEFAKCDYDTYVEIEDVGEKQAILKTETEEQQKEEFEITYGNLLHLLNPLQERFEKPVRQQAISETEAEEQKFEIEDVGEKRAILKTETEKLKVPKICISKKVLSTISGAKNLKLGEQKKPNVNVGTLQKNNGLQVTK